MTQTGKLLGERAVITFDDPVFPQVLREVPSPPKQLYVVGSMQALRPGIAVVGARKATPYGEGCARRFALLAAARGIVVISGGARGCDAAAHAAAVEQSAPTVVVLGGGIDKLYPAEHQRLFQRVIDGGGAVVSEYPWEHPPLPRCFRARNRIIAGLARATLIVEAGLPSGTFSTADEALAAGREVLAIPGAITSKTSAGANRLICQGATPIVDDESFTSMLDTLFGPIQMSLDFGRSVSNEGTGESTPAPDDPLMQAIRADPQTLDQLLALTREQFPREDPFGRLMVWIAEGERLRKITRYPDGRYGPVLVS